MIISLKNSGLSFEIDKSFKNIISSYSWSLDSNGYVVTYKNGKQIYLHRLIMSPKNNERVDHINHNLLDNTKKNLRICNQAQNQWNRIKKIPTKSKYKGLSWDRTRNKWKVYVEKYRKRYYIGIFKDELDAAKAYDNAAVKYFGEFAKTNF